MRRVLVRSFIMAAVAGVSLCSGIYLLAAGIKTRTQHVTRELERIDEDARRRGIYPGVMPDLKRAYGFE